MEALITIGEIDNIKQHSGKNGLFYTFRLNWKTETKNGSYNFSRNCLVSNKMLIDKIKFIQTGDLVLVEGYVKESEYAVNGETKLGIQNTNIYKLEILNKRKWNYNEEYNNYEQQTQEQTEDKKEEENPWELDF